MSTNYVSLIKIASKTVFPIRRSNFLIKSGLKRFSSDSSTNDNTTEQYLDLNGDLDGFLEPPKGFATKAIHVGQEPEQWKSMAVVPPISLSTTFKQYAPAKHAGFEYSRSGNPTRKCLETCLASLDNGKYGLTFASGLGATTCILTSLKTGDHIIAGDDLYGGTNRLFRNVAIPMGIEVDFIDYTHLEMVEKCIKPNTRLMWLETPTNPLMKVCDIRALADLAHRIKSDIIVIVDNTFLTPYLQRPLDLGADIAAYSLTKYMNGHSDVIMGGIVTNNEAIYTRLKFLQNSTGIVPSPFDCYQVNRSLKTLDIRMEKHKRNSMIVAKYLEAHPMVERVLHPGLKSHPQYDTALKQTGGHSGVFSFYLRGDYEDSCTFLKTLEIFTLAESLGGFESLAELPSVMTHASIPADIRAQLGITDNLIRLSVGLEDPEDLMHDIEKAFAAVKKQTK